MQVVGLLHAGMLMASAALLMACTIPDESASYCLPEPTPRRVDPPAYTPEQQARKEEVDQFLCDRYQEEGWQILETTQTYTCASCLLASTHRRATDPPAAGLACTLMRPALRLGVACGARSVRYSPSCSPG